MEAKRVGVLKGIKVGSICNRWLSRGGMITLVMVALEAILGYWHFLSWIMSSVSWKIFEKYFLTLHGEGKEKVEASLGPNGRLLLSQKGRRYGV